MPACRRGGRHADEQRRRATTAASGHRTAPEPGAPTLLTISFNPLFLAPNPLKTAAFIVGNDRNAQRWGNEQQADKAPN
jgi:hypothetical protein